jgi:trk system potassium uptake protein TrkH
MLGILHVLAVAVAGLFALIVPAVLFAIADGMRDLALSMLLVGALGVFAALMVLGSISGFQRSLGAGLGLSGARRDVGLVPMVAAVSFRTLAGLSWVDAWFEAVSALTTSGATLISRETAPQAILFWRASSIEWYGGFSDAAVDHPCAGPGRFWWPAGR